MPSWKDQGHAMRRRNGSPMNHFEAAGPTNGRAHSTSEENYEMAKGKDSPRIALGEGPIDSAHEVMSPEQNAPDKGTLVSKKNTQSSDPSYMGPMTGRNNVLQERLGASYRVSVPYTPTMDPSLGPTQGQGRIIPSVQGRQNPDFMGAASEQY